jgi:RNA polymerase sigma-70 factor, ECF subfamily
MPGQHTPDEIRRSPASEPSDHSLIGRSREGDQDAATQLYLRYAQRLNSLVATQCSAELARRAGVDDIVQSVFGSFFRRVRQGFYDAPDGDELWKLLLVIALNKIRTKATYYHAAKRDAHRTVDGPDAEERLDSQPGGRAPASGHLELALEEIIERLPPQHQLMVRLRLNGCEVVELARMTGRSRRSVERILHETRLKLRELLREEE